MDQFVTFTILGLSTAAIYAVAASGLVVTYTTSGIFNFAHGAIGMLAAFLYWELGVEQGLPGPIPLILVVCVAAPLFGAAIERVIFRGLEGTSEVTKLVVSVGLLVALMAAAVIFWPPQNRQIPGFFHPNKFEVLGTNVTWHQAIIVVTAVLVAFGLRGLLFGTRTGVSMRAVVDDRPLARLNGANPDRASMLSWAIGSGLAALAGVLIVSEVGLTVIPLTLLVVNAYAAAVFGRLQSLPLTFLGALVLGLGQSYSIGYLPTDWTFFGYSLAGLRSSIPVFLLFIVLMVIPQARLRGHGVLRSREFIPSTGLARSILNALALVVVVALAVPFLSISNTFLLSAGLATAIIMVSLVPLTGWGGQISLAQMTFAGIGAVTMAKVGGDGTLWGLVAAAALTAAVGAVVALPALRLTGIYLALATLAFAVFMDSMVFPQQRLGLGTSLEVGRLDLPGLSFDGDGAYTILLAVSFGLLGVGVAALRRGPFGRKLLAMKDSPAACATLGLNLTMTKVGVFALSAGMAGLGGALFGGFREIINPEFFSFVQSLPILLLAVVGGIAVVGGALFGGLLFAMALPLIQSNAPEGSFLFDWLTVENLVLLAPGLIGIGLGRNPNGIVVDTSTAIREAREAAAAKRVARAAGETAHAPLETLGIDRPFTADEMREVDRQLGIDEAEVPLRA